ncbi:MAG: GNAT family N-acetyltransferase [Clostridiaceae bacterium]
MYIQQNNLVIRNATKEDAPILGKWWRNGEVMAHAGFPNGLDTTDEQIASELSADTDDTCRRLIIEVNGHPVGEMNYRNKGNLTAEIGIKICESSEQEKGYGTRLLSMLTNALLCKQGYVKIILDTNLNNTRAQHVYEKLGFRKLRINHNSWSDQLGQPQSSVDYEMTKADWLNECKNHWYAYIYEQQVIQADEVAFILDTVGNVSKRILEVACGGGRILAPLARAGHIVTGFDSDKAMLERCELKIKPLSNANCYYADAVTEDWGREFDVVVLAGNILLNIVSDMDYSQAQTLFIRKTTEALKNGGHLYLDFDCYDRPSMSSENKREWVCFKGMDDRGTYGKYIVVSGDYSVDTRIDRSSRRYEITPVNGNTEIFEVLSIKHFPTLLQVHTWLSDAGFVIEQEFGGYDRHPINESEIGNRAIIWARKR